MPEEIDINDIKSDMPTSASNDVDPDINNFNIRIHKEKVVPNGASDREFIEALLSNSNLSVKPEKCQIPSRGIYYGWNNDGILEVTPMTISTEKAMAVSRNGGQLVDNMISTCVRLPNGYTSLDLLPGDRSFLLYFIRGITYGNHYEFMLTCPACKQQNSHIYDLNELCRSIKWANPSLGLEPFKVVLPIMSQKHDREVYVRIRFPRASDTIAIMKSASLKKKISQSVAHSVGDRNTEAVDEAYTNNLDHFIVDINGQVSEKFSIRQFMNMLTASDISEIKEFMKVNAPGIDTSIIATCPECGEKIETMLPLSDKFFRRTDARPIRT